MDETVQKIGDSISWPPLQKGILVKRYKRFMADVRLKNGDIVTAHCANSGRMLACSQPGRVVYLTTHDNPKRKLKYTWEMIEMPESMVGVNTMIPNRLVALSIRTGRVPDLEGYDSIQREVKTGQDSRLDICLRKDDGDCCYVEVKNCTLVTTGLAQFPDAVTARGRKHLVEMQRLVSNGDRCAMFYLIQRMDATVFAPADHIDPEYGKELRLAVANGVELFAYDVVIDLEGIRLGKRVPVVL
jgi:sugar fermentation stimulation protein A